MGHAGLEGSLASMQRGWAGFTPCGLACGRVPWVAQAKGILPSLENMFERVDHWITHAAPGYGVSAAGSQLGGALEGT